MQPIFKQAAFSPDFLGTNYVNTIDGHIVLLLCGSMLWLTATGCGSGSSEAPVSQAPARQAAGQATEHGTLPTPHDEIVAPEAPRPLISDTTGRNPFRPPTIHVHRVSTRQVSKANIRLLGFAQKESQRIAVLEKEGTIYQVRNGEFIGPWEVREVADAIVRLRRGTEEIVLQLD